MSNDRQAKEIIMLANKDAMATIAVKDIARSRRFYEDKLGLERTGDEMQGIAAYKTGGSTLMVYQSGFAGTNQATSVTWNIGGNIEDLVATLKAQGIAFEHYDMPEMTRQGDIHLCGDMKAAWFKDPDGNIHNLAGR